MSARRRCGKTARLRGIRALIAAAAWVFSSGASPPDHLYPEDSPFDHAIADTILNSYALSLVSVLKDIYEETTARVIVVPSFETEFAVGVAQDGDLFRLVTLRPDKQIWLFLIRDEYRNEDRSSYSEKQRRQRDENLKSLDAELPRSLTGVNVARCEAPLEAEIGAVLLKLWERALRETRYPATYWLGLDGVEYHFSGQFGRSPMMSGRTWSPRPGTTMGRLVGIVTLLNEACPTKDRSKLEEAGRLAQDLCRDFACADAP